ncbi:transposase [Acinetobacter sp. F_3_1]
MRTPKYSPDVNPIEKMWAWLKQERKCPPDLEHRQVKYKNKVIMAS